MATGKITATYHGISFSAIICGILGGAFFWWVPMGIVLSLTGLLLGFIDWTIARRCSMDFRLSIVGMLVSVAAMSLDLVILYLEWQTVTFGGQ